MMGDKPPPPLEALASSLPCEIIRHILLKLPSKTLLRFKCVSKSWNALISDPQFTQSHHNLSTRGPNIIYPGKNESTFSTVCFEHEEEKIQVENLNFPVPNARILCVCEELVLLEDKNHGEEDCTYYLWNPSVREYAKFSYPFPFHDHKTLGYGLYYDSSACDYMVMVFHEHHYLIYSVKRDSWGESKVNPYPGTRLSCCVFVNGALHWDAARRVGWVPCVDGGDLPVFAGPPSGDVACFNPAEDSFIMFPRPEVEDERSSYGLIAFGDCLGFFSYDDRPKRTSIWVRTKNDNDLSSWDTLMVISDVPEPSVEPNDDWCSLIPLFYFWESELLVLCYRKEEGGEVFIYDVKGKKFLKLDVPPIAVYSRPFTYINSLLLPGVGDNPKRKWVKTGTSECVGTGTMTNWRRMLFGWLLVRF